MVVSVFGALIAVTDQLSVGLLATAAAVGAYQIGNMLPAQAIGFLFGMYDTIYPRLVQQSSRSSQERVTQMLTMAICFVAGFGLALLAWNRVGVITLLFGKYNALAGTVLVLFCFTWMLDVPFHGLALLLIARGRQMSYVPVYGCELALNAATTFPTVLLMGPKGAAVATLVTSALSHLIALPVATRREFVNRKIRTVMLRGVLGTAVGSVFATLIYFAWSPFSDSRLRLFVTLISGAAFLGLSAALALATVASPPHRGRGE
jgi:O-antigen/teichoic acid export membrane protein